MARCAKGLNELQDMSYALVNIEVTKTEATRLTRSKDNVTASGAGKAAFLERESSRERINLTALRLGKRSEGEDVVNSGSENGMVDKKGFVTVKRATGNGIGDAMSLGT